MIEILIEQTNRASNERVLLGMIQGFSSCNTTLVGQKNVSFLVKVLRQKVDHYIKDRSSSFHEDIIENVLKVFGEISKQMKVLFLFFLKMFFSTQKKPGNQ